MSTLENAISLATAENGGEAEKQANHGDLQGVTPIELESHLRDLNPGPPLYERDADESQSPCAASICDEGAGRLVLLLTQLQTDADFARLAERWPTLSEGVRAALLALLDSR